MLSCEELHVLDSKLVSLTRLTSASTDHGAIAAHVEEIIESVQQQESDAEPHKHRLIRPGWRQFWRQQKGVAWAWFFDPNYQENEVFQNKEVTDALLDVFSSMIRFVMDGTSPVRKQDYCERLRSSCQHYLFLRGYETKQPDACRSITAQQKTLDRRPDSMDRKMFDKLKAHRDELRAVEDGWYSRYCQDGRTIGVSFWDTNLDKLREIDERHGIHLGDPRVYSIVAYSAEREEIEETWQRLCKAKSWINLDSASPRFKEFWVEQGRHWARLDDCKARHFPGLNSGTIDTVPNLWAYIVLQLLVVRELADRITSNQNQQRSEVCEKDVQQVYSIMHRLKIPWAPAPPYPSFTPQEATDELTRIANQIEREDAEQSGELVIDTLKTDGAKWNVRIEHLSVGKGALSQLGEHVTEQIEFPLVAPLFSDALDRVVIVEDESDEKYLRCWMERILPTEVWDKISSRRFCIPTGRRPTGDEVNQRLDTIKHIHPEEQNFQPKAFVIADRDYRLDEELVEERSKLLGREFKRQTWHVWERVEIENYLVCPEIMVRYIMERALAAEVSSEQQPPKENEIRTLVEEAIESSRSAVRDQLIDSFDRRHRNWVLSTVVKEAEQFLDSVWQGERRKDCGDAKEVVLPRLKSVLKDR